LHKMAEAVFYKNRGPVIHKVPVREAYRVLMANGNIESYSEEIDKEPTARAIHRTVGKAMYISARRLGFGEIDDYSVIKYCFCFWLLKGEGNYYQCHDFFMDWECGTYYASDKWLADAVLASLKELLDDVSGITGRIIKGKMKGLRYRNERREPDRPIRLLK